jgi:hypothetical protein
MSKLDTLPKLFVVSTAIISSFMSVNFLQAEELKGNKIYNYPDSNRVSRYRKKVFDRDLIHPHELPGGEPYIRTTRGWKGVDTGQIYNRSWLAKKRGITLEELNKRDEVRKEILPPRDPRYEMLPGEEEIYPYTGPTGLEPDDDAM